MLKDIVDTAVVQSILQAVADAGRIVVCCHKSPDGDALGSSLAVAALLRQNGKDTTVVVPDAYPDFLQWLPGSDRIVRHDKRPEAAEEAMAGADLVFCLDFNSVSRVEGLREALEKTPARKIMVDHHLAPEPFADIAVSRPDMSSTSEMVFRLVRQAGLMGQVGKDSASCLYCGMMTDTGGFTYNSGSPEIYLIISELLSKGIDKDRIYRRVFHNYSHWAIRLRGHVMCNKLRMVDGLHASYYTISKEEMARFHFVRGDAEGLVNEPLRIKGNRLSIALREDDRRADTVWVSLRSVDSFPCNKMAEEFFNGGGHLNASGGRLHCSLEEAAEVAEKAIRAYAALL